MKSAVITFPGSNCDRDMRVAIKKVTGKEPVSIWHGDHTLPESLDFIALPGGFSYGDYLRSGAIAAKSPIMSEIKKAADAGVFILGVCNGFQILTEAGLLPGTLMRNDNLNFICKTAALTIENNDTAFTHAYTDDRKTLNIPVAHHDGSYFIDDEGLKALHANKQIAFSYANENINGSKGSIAGILNHNKNVLGMMPHPERAVESETGGTDGIRLFESIIKSVA